MTGHRSFSELTAKLPPARKERIAARASELRAEMALAELRQARALSQEELARVLGVKQPAVAKLEKRADMYVSNRAQVARRAVAQQICAATSRRWAARWRSARNSPAPR